MQATRKKIGMGKQQGNAIVFALLIVALTAIIATALIQTSSFSVRRTAALVDMDVNWQAILAAELVADQLLNQSDIADLETVTTLQQDWARPWQLQLDDDVSVTAQIYDLQGQFNVNLLAQGPGNSGGIYTPTLVFTRLLIQLNLPDAQALTRALAYWVGSSQSQVDQDYLRLTPPYRVAHAPLASITELALIMGFSCDLLTELKPYISALPDGGSINVNTASTSLLTAVLDAPEALVEALVTERDTQAFSTTQEFISRAQARGVPISDTSALQGLISVNSRYFLLETQVNSQNNTMIGYSFLRRLSTGEVEVYQHNRHVL